jgi:thioredoxin 1
MLSASIRTRFQATGFWVFLKPLDAPALVLECAANLASKRVWRTEIMAVAEVTDATFESDVLRADRPVIVDFWAPWCVPCRRVSPILEEMSEAREDVNFVKVNVDDNPQAAMNYSISSIPTIARFEAGQVTQQAIGALPKNQLSAQLGL